MSLIKGHALWVLIKLSKKRDLMEQTSKMLLFYYIQMQKGWFALSAKLCTYCLLLVIVRGMTIPLL
jgi:hypothetical protein